MFITCDNRYTLIHRKEHYKIYNNTVQQPCNKKNMLYLNRVRIYCNVFS